MDLYGYNIFNGGKINLWDCNGTLAQKWTYDTGGRIRLKYDYNLSGDFCVDNNYGVSGSKLYLWQCTGNTERWRPNNFEFRVISRAAPWPGHAFDQLIQFDNANNVIANTTYSLWPSWQGRDNDSQNTQSNYKEANDRSQAFWFDDRWVNRDSDLADGYNVTQNGNYNNGTGYWLKWIPNWQYDQIKDGGYKVDPYIYTVIENCSTYSTTLWVKYKGRRNYYSPTFGWWPIIGEPPSNLTTILYTDYSY